MWVDENKPTAEEIRIFWGIPVEWGIPLDDTSEKIIDECVEYAISHILPDYDVEVE